MWGGKNRPKNLYLESRLIIKEHKNKFDLIMSSHSQLWKADFVCEKQLGSTKSHFIGVKSI